MMDRWKDHFCCPMDLPIRIKAIRMGLSIIYFKGPQVVISHLQCISVPVDCFLPLQTV